MGAIGVADLAYKYGSAIFQKKDFLARGRKTDTRFKKSSSATTFKKIIEKRSRPSLANGELIRGSYAKSVKIRPGYGLDVAVYSLN